MKKQLESNLAKILYFAEELVPVFKIAEGRAAGKSFKEFASSKQMLAKRAQRTTCC